MSYNDEFYISLIGETFDGYSEFSYKEEPIFIKHISIKDQRYLQKYYERYKKLAIAKHHISKILFLTVDAFSKNRVILIWPPSTNVKANAKNEAAAIQYPEYSAKPLI